MVAVLVIGVVDVNIIVDMVFLIKIGIHTEVLTT